MKRSERNVLRALLHDVVEHVPRLARGGTQSASTHGICGYARDAEVLQGHVQKVLFAVLTFDDAEDGETASELVEEAKSWVREREERGWQ